MRKLNLFKTIVIFTLLVIMTSCSSTSTETTKKEGSLKQTTVDTVLEESKTPFLAKSFAAMIKPELFQFNPADDFVVTTKKGMKISIGQGTLLNADNEVAEGEVDLEVKEYYSAGEIILSQLPMHYTDSGVLQHFESDGMFTIVASQNNEVLHIAEGKEIEVETKRSKEGEGFEFYQLNKDNNWVKDQKNEVTLVQSLTQTAVVLRPSRPVQEDIVKFNANYYTLESDDRAYLPEVSSLSSGDYVRQIDIDVKEDPWILDRSKWRFARDYGQILKRKEAKEEAYDTIPYIVFYAVRGNKKYKHLIEKQAEDLANYKKGAEAYETYLVQQKHSGELSDQEFVQKLFISQFGTYNIDRYYMQNQKYIVEKPFVVSVPEQVNQGSRIYLVVKTSNQLIPIDLTVYPGILRFNRSENNALLAMTEEGVFRVNLEDFKQLTKEQRKNIDYKFSMKQIDFADVTSLDEAIDKLF
jgi:hypothetical protein